MAIIGGNVSTFMATKSLKARPDIGLRMFQQVPGVQRAVGVGQGTGDEDFS